HIKVMQSTQIRHVAITHELATHESAPLATILRHTLKVSVNFNAEMVLHELGAHRTGHGTRKTGIAAVRAEAHQLKTSLGTVLDGSGLSWLDRGSPQVLVRWLTQARSSAAFPYLLAGLPVSCRYGTLEDRMCGPRLAGKVRAKTGTLDHARTLTGFTTTS